MRQLFFLPSFIIIFIIRLYQLLLSPLFGVKCRYQPSCSVYTIEAIKKNGLIKGLWLGFKRVLRCHPFGKFGYDPPP